MIQEVGKTIYTYFPWVYLGVLGVVVLWVMFSGRRPGDHHRLFRSALIAAAIVQWAFLLLYTLLLWLSVKHTTGPQAYMPPYSTYIFDKIAQYAVTYISGWVAAGALFLAMWWLFVRRQGGRLLDVQDVLLLTLGAAIVGWPNVLVFLAVTFLVAVAWMVVLVVLRKRSLQDRLIITPAILPAVLITLACAHWVLNVTNLIKIRF